MITREAGQSLASAEALERWWAATQVTSDARMEVNRLLRDLRAARKVLRAAQAAEDAASREYEATPYAE